MMVALRTMTLGIGATVALALAGCSVTPATGTNTNGGNGGNGGGGSGTVTFNVTVNWSGPDPLQGSFSDPQTGSGFSSCSQYASENTPLGWISPSPPNQTSVQVQGKTLGFLFTVGKANFHGPGTYPNALTAGVQVGSDTFLGSHTAASSVTLNADGSGQASFSGFFNLSRGSDTNLEQGTISWTCSG